MEKTEEQKAFDGDYVFPFDRDFIITGFAESVVKDPELREVLDSLEWISKRFYTVEECLYKVERQVEQIFYKIPKDRHRQSFDERIKGYWLKVHLEYFVGYVRDFCDTSGEDDTSGHGNECICGRCWFQRRIKTLEYIIKNCEVC